MPLNQARKQSFSTFLTWKEPLIPNTSCVGCQGFTLPLMSGNAIQSSGANTCEDEQASQHKQRRNRISPIGIIMRQYGNTGNLQAELAAKPIDKKLAKPCL